MAKKTAAKKPTTKRAAKKKSTDKASVDPVSRVAKGVAAPKNVAASLRTLATAINAKSESEYGFAAAGEFYSDITSWVSTTCVPLDVKLWGGFPRGRIVDIHGDPSQGKSTLMESVFLGNQRDGGENVLLMSESCIDTHRMQREGLDLTSFLPLEIESFEQGVFWILEALNHRAKLPAEYCREHPLTIGWDTPSNAQEQHLIDKPEEQFSAGMASKARSVRSALRTITPLAGRLNVTIMLLFQTHQKIGSAYAGKDTDCGGGPKFNATLRIWARQKDRLWKENNYSDRDIGILSEMTIVKSKAGCPPFRSAIVPIRSLDGVDNDLAMFMDLQDTWVCDPCTVCGGRVAKGMAWESLAFQTCDACRRTGEVQRMFSGSPATVTSAGVSSAGHATAWRYICGWPNEGIITFKDEEIHEVLDARPGLRTWLAQQCWRKCTKPEPAVFHPVEGV